MSRARARCRLALRRLALGRRGEEGTVTAFVVVFMFALILLAGLVIDGGLTLAAQVRAIDEAQAAARAGAQEIDVALLRSTGQVTLDPALASQAAESYLAATGDAGTVQVDGDEVEVSVSISQPMQILSLAGIAHLTVTGHGSAFPSVGVDAGSAP
ncbi:MAG: pilus assembly protein TadG-related protein [Acidimicrobiales bacterium]